MGYPIFWRELNGLIEDVTTLTAHVRKIGRKMGIRLDAAEGDEGPPGDDGDDSPSRFFRGMRVVMGPGDPVHRWFQGGTNTRYFSFFDTQYTTFAYQTTPDPNDPAGPPLPVWANRGIQSGGSSYGIFVAPYAGVYRFGVSTRLFVRAHSDTAHVIRLYLNRNGPDGEDNHILADYQNAYFAGFGGVVDLTGMIDTYMHQGETIQVGTIVDGSSTSAGGTQLAERAGGDFSVEYLGLPVYDERGTDSGDPDATANLIFNMDYPGLLTVEGEDVFMDWKAEVGLGAAYTKAQFEAYIQSVLTDPLSWCNQLGIIPRHTEAANVTWYILEEALCAGRDVGCAINHGDGTGSVQIENSHFGNIFVANHEAGHIYFSAQHAGAGSVMDPSVDADPEWPSLGDINDVEAWMAS